jgi:hypothetical protein
MPSACLLALTTIIAAFQRMKATDAALDVLVAGEPRLLLARDRVDVRGADGGREADLAGTGPIEELRQQEPGPRLAVGRR